MRDGLTREMIDNSTSLQAVAYVAPKYGCTAGIVRYGEYDRSSKEYLPASDKADKGYYIVAAPGNEFPDFDNPKDVERRRERNIGLFHPKEFAMQITADNIDNATHEFVSWCYSTALIHKLYNDYGCQVPQRITLAEIMELETYYYGSKDFSRFDSETMKDYKRSLDAFFKEEKKAEKNKHYRKQKGYFRSDCSMGQFNRLFKPTKIHQQIPFQNLTFANNSIGVVVVTEDMFYDFQEKIKDYPFVFYSVGQTFRRDDGEVMVDSEDNPWAGTEARYSLKEILYKKVDEPYVLGLIYKIRAKDVVTNQIGNRKDSVVRYIPEGWFSRFLKYAKEHRMKFDIDAKADIGLATPDSVPIVLNIVEANTKFRGFVYEINNGQKDVTEDNVLDQPYFDSEIDRMERVREMQSDPEARNGKYKDFAYGKDR